jgi:hypothetical protein
MSGVARRPAWSELLTRPLSHAIPDIRRPVALRAIKAIHTAIFASVGAAIAVFVWDGIRQRPGRRSAYALGIALAETGVYVSNNQVCPLTPLAEELGAERGAVADLFLPSWAARSIPLVASTALLLGLVLNGRARLTGRGRPRVAACRASWSGTRSWCRR